MRLDVEHHKKKAQPKSSYIESYSFVAYFLTFPFGIAYILWIITPSDVMEQINMTYYPPKMLAYLVPVIVIVGFVFIPFFYTILNEITVPRFTSTSHISDDYANINRNAIHRTLRPSPGIPDVQDLDVSYINDFHGLILTDKCFLK